MCGKGVLQKSENMAPGKWGRRSRRGGGGCANKIAMRGRTDEARPEPRPIGGEGVNEPSRKRDWAKVLRSGLIRKQPAGLQRSEGERRTAGSES